LAPPPQPPNPQSPIPNPQKFKLDLKQKIKYYESFY